MKIYRFFCLAALCLFLSACANYKLHYATEAESWTQRAPASDQELAYSLYLIGDSGEHRPDQPPEALGMLKRYLQDEGEDAGVIFLGNNLAGRLRGADRRNRRSAYRKILTNQLDAVKDFPGDIFFLPGENDWSNRGVKGLEWEKDLIEEYLDRDDIWMPDPGCSGPEEVDLTDDIVLLLADSDWYLRDWEGEIDINSDCAVKSRKVFRWLVNEEVKGNRHRNTVIAMHHPLISYGPHGGAYPLEDHLFPLRAINDKLWIPLPIIGSLTTYLRASVGSRRDQAHPVYQELVGAFMDPARQNGRYIFVGAHDHSLQHIERDSQVFIVSGAGGDRITASHTGKDGEFAYSHPGFSRIDFYADGSAWALYFITDDNDPQGRLVYRKQVKGPFPERVDPPEPVFDPIPPGATITLPVSRHDYDRSKMWRFFFGEHYRSTYKAEITVPLFDLTRFNGGVEPVQRGGGAQTNSLRLEDKKGRQYTLRSVDKDATRTVPYPFNRDIVLAIVEDNFSASHPFGALAAAHLSAEIGIPHNNPKVVYLPRQAALGEYNDDYAEALYLLEERPDDEVWQDADFFGNPEDIESTEDMLEEIRESHDEVVDQHALVYARLFDMVLGDWDRHDDQWRWGFVERDSLEYFYPIPRDRDQVFSHYDGFAGLFVRQTAPNAKQFTPFRKRIGNTKWENYNARYLDQSLLTGLEWPDWEAAAERLFRELTDDRIDRSLKETWPANIYALEGPAIAAKMKSRRDQIVRAARQRYLYLAKRVDVTGTDEKDLFEIERLNNDSLRIRVWDTNSDREKELLFYERTFLHKETKEINIYGLADDDYFVISGSGRGGPTIRLIGGLGEDHYEDNSEGPTVHIFDAKDEERHVAKKGNFQQFITDDPFYNLYDRKSPDYEYNYGGIFPSIAFNPEDGIFLGATAKYFTYGFKKQPFASEHTLNVGVSLRTYGIKAGYTGIFTDVLGTWDLQMSLQGQTPLYTNNYYGMGNNSLNQQVLETQDRTYHQVRLSHVELYPALLRRYPSNATLSLGPTLEYFSLDRTEGRYIDDIAPTLPSDIFEGRFYVGAKGAFRYRNQDDTPVPTRGLAVELSGGWKQRLDIQQQSFAFAKAAFTFYQRLEPTGRLVFATRVGMDHRFSNDFEFFQGATIGGTGPQANFRGLPRDRFTGNTAFYHNTDLRLKVLDSDQWGPPMSLGILAGYDHGRVWLDGDESPNHNIWHQSYGGGIWITPLNIFLVNLSYFRGTDGNYQFTLLGSYFF